MSQRIRVWIEQGVWWDLDDEAAEGFRKTVRFFQSHELGDIYVTSGREGTLHLPHSYHHSRRAFDLRVPEGFTEALRANLKEALGSRWVVLNETTHLHFQCNWRN